VRAYADNVIIVFEPPPDKSRSGLVDVVTKVKNRGVRTARVIASGPGHYLAVKRKGSHTLCEFTEDGGFIPNETKPGDRVVVDAIDGQDYALDVSIPRHNKNADFQELLGERGQFRVVREESIMLIIPDDARVE